MFVFTYFLTTIYVILTIYELSDTITTKQLLIFDYEVYYVVFLHAITLIICKAVHLANNRLYKLLAYRITLKKRQQIVENVKVIKFLWPTIFIFALFAPIGPLVSMIYKIITDKNAPIVFSQLSYNFSFLLMMGFRVYKSFKKQRSTESPEKFMVVVKNPFGKEIPTNVETEIYFKQLNEQWK
uniref:Uncharacterized protein n=1 Tax=Panagrolaimus sp. PS1159 TaxID=55785 RepID=A0AC35GRC2_9BILA